jgi:hypothetical protein
MVEQATFRHSAGEDAPGEDGQECRSLVPVESSGLKDGPRSHRRPAASFLAHLIATAQQAPQTRARRQAEPGEASARYAATAARPRERRGSLVLPSL